MEPRDSKLLTEAVTCPVCTEVYTRPKLLPCGHSLCLGCLEQLAQTQDSLLPGDLLSCPLCRHELRVPAKGLSSLPNNFYIDTLVRIRSGEQQPVRHVTDEEAGLVVQCEICFEDGTTEFNQASRYCTECRQNLCEKCAKSHGKQTATKSHCLVPVGQTGAGGWKGRESLDCPDHPTKRLDIYCADCAEPSCVLCWIERHRDHKHRDIDEVAAELRDILQKDLAGIAAAVGTCQQSCSKLTESRHQLDCLVKSLEKQISEETEDVIETIRAEHSRLLQELQQVKQPRAKQLVVRSEEVDGRLSTLQTFSQRVELVVRSVSSVELVSCFESLHARALELQAMQLDSSLEPTAVMFKPSDMRSYLPPHGVTLVGQLEVSDGPWSSSQPIKTWTELNEELAQCELKHTAAVTRADTLTCDLAQLRREAEEQQAALLQQLSLSEDCQRHIAALLTAANTDLSQSREREAKHRDEAAAAESQLKELKDQLEQAGKHLAEAADQENSLTLQLCQVKADLFLAGQKQVTEAGEEKEKLVKQARDAELRLKATDDRLFKLSVETDNLKWRLQQAEQREAELRSQLQRMKPA